MLSRIFGGFFFIVMIKCETIHFTNSPSHLLRSKNFTSYKLEVPGSNSITIVEANDGSQSLLPLNSANEQKDSEDNSLSSVRNQSSKKTVFAPTLLEKFLHEYKSKMQTSMSVDSEENLRAQGLRKDRYRDYDKFNDDDYHRTKMKNPFNDKEGWVSLQAIPWSKSHVSKWKPKGEVKPLETVSSLNVFRKPDQYKYDGFSKWDNNEELSHYVQHRPNSYEYDENDQFGSSNSHTSGSYSSTVPWNTNKPLKWSNQNQEIEVADDHDQWYDNRFRPDYDEHKKPIEDEIIVSDYNSNIVRIPIKKKHQKNVQPYTIDRSHNSNHPSTYPSNGNGEWILLSTTKGYNTNRVHRAMKFSSSLPPSNLSSTLKTHRAIKLTVLPAKPGIGNETTMTTLHGGLLEVDSSLQPVEVSAAAEVNKKKNKSKIKGNIKTKFVRAVPIDSKTNDESAVLAAVGAGMVPATVAMLMPMVVGRRKRSISVRYPLSKEYRL